MAAPQKLTAVKAIKGFLHEGQPVQVGGEINLEATDANYLIESDKAVLSKDFPAWAEKNKKKN
jgi:hypothetical protein